MKIPRRLAISVFTSIILIFCIGIAPIWAELKAPLPLVAKDQPVDWWFVFKFNGKTFPGCGTHVDRACPFGGEVHNYSS